ncbi:MAG: 1-deoxy-D-xylulose-5-phosphate reductoisomerase [Clostridia bacterium]|nr:1-deoxy-D-xylulose-5-phosphate reductoisomerase [Clostridia bacterium]
MRRISILGSTGSIGTQALELVRLHPDRFQVTALTAHRQADRLFEQVREFRPAFACLTDPAPGLTIPDDLSFCEFAFGPGGLKTAATQAEADMVLVSIVGIAGLQSVMDALGAGRQVLLANKEALVTGGHLVTEAARKCGKPLLPVDSEHSAIFQCLQGAMGNPAEKLLLTASGGPFRTWKKEDIRRATREQALRHPNWAMGAKITIDSATMFNKALEIMEARWLFDMPAEKIQVVVHPQSIVHSAVVFADGAVLAQLGVPDMRVPIQLAMAYPERLDTGCRPLDLFAIGQLTFEKGDPERFPALRLAGECLAAGGAACTVLNGANEEAVAAFLAGQITFGQITDAVEAALEALPGLPADSLEDIFEADRAARRAARDWLGRQN